MGLFDKAKGAFKDLEQQLDKVSKAVQETGLSNSETKELQRDLHIVNQQAARLGVNDTPNISETSSVPSTVVLTPASSIAPKKMATKLPLAIRKEVRDDWESKIPELEASLSQVLKVAWTINIDAGAMYTYALQTPQMSTRAKASPGAVLYTYVEKTIGNLKTYIDKFGADGLEELNKVASAHVITMAEATDPAVTYSGCDIHEGTLRILFGKGNWGSNVDQCTNIDRLPIAINKAGAATSALDFDTRRGIKEDYDTKIGALKTRFETTLAIQGLVLDPNFEANYAKLSAAAAAGTSLPRDWQKRLGGHAHLYFENLAKSLEAEGFAQDDMLQEGLADVMDKSLVKLEVVDTVSNGSYNETVPEDGTLFIRVTPKYWSANVGNVGKGLVKLL